MDFYGSQKKQWQGCSPISRHTHLAHGINIAQVGSHPGEVTGPLIWTSHGMTCFQETRETPCQRLASMWEYVKFHDHIQLQRGETSRWLIYMARTTKFCWVWYLLAKIPRNPHMKHRPSWPKWIDPDGEASSGYSSPQKESTDIQTKSNEKSGNW